jgi:hypothetical protein
LIPEKVVCEYYDWRECVKSPTQVAKSDRRRPVLMSEGRRLTIKRLAAHRGLTAYAGFPRYLRKQALRKVAGE